MREIKNNVLRDLTFEEHEAIIEAAKILQRAFKRKIYGCFLNADNKNPEECFAVNYTFDMMNPG